MKSMKKSMFVTTILMVVLLIVALSTATFAWYTANTQVGTTLTQITTASSTTASLVIDDHKANNSESNASVVLAMSNAASANVPMIYANDNALTGAATYANFMTAGSFKTLTRDVNNNVATAPVNATPSGLATCTGTGSPASYIVLTNIGGGTFSSVSTQITINPFYTPVANVEVGVTNVTGKYTLNEGVYTEITAANTLAAADTTYYEIGNRDFLRVAVFVSTTADGDYTLKGICGAGNAARGLVATVSEVHHLAAATTGEAIDTVIGANTLNADAAENNSGFVFVTSGNSITIGSNLAGNSALYVKVIAWFEGGSLLNTDGGLTASFSMAFSAALA